MIKSTADHVLVTSDPDVSKFVTPKRNKSQIVVVRGGVDLKPSNKYLKDLASSKNILNKKYDACFVGRFHYQKGVIELIKIWQLVCKKRKDTTLAMIGVGSLETAIREEIHHLGLEKNIILLGFLTGKPKFKIFKQSKIVVHPATYDSGGMAACEAMAWGLPGVSFDLDALKTYYPKGMVKTPCFDFNKFSDNILKLLEDRDFYDKIRTDALSWTQQWDWDKRSQFTFDQVL